VPFFMGNHMTDATNGAEVLNARNSAMQDIAKRQHEAVAPDLAELDEETGQVVPNSAEQSQNDEQEPEPPPVVEEDTLIVDGKEVRVSKEKIIEAGRRTLQKESAADKRLQEATELYRRAEEYARQVGATAPSKDVHQSPPGEGVTTEANHEQQSQQIDVQAIDRTIDQRLDDKLYLRDAEKAAQQFEKEFPEIASNPMLRHYAVQLENQRIAEAMANGRDLGDPYTAYRKHGEAVREQLKGLGVTKPAEDKHERKRDTVTVSGANVRTAAPQQDKPKTVQQTITDMRKARHQRIE
jgi:hypothetical protein